MIKPEGESNKCREQEEKRRKQTEVRDTTVEREMTRNDK